MTRPFYSHGSGRESLYKKRKEMGELPKVYVTQIPARMVGRAWVPTVDISPASQFGEIKVCLPSGLNFHAPVPVIRQLRDELHEFNGQEDYFLPLGDPLVMAVAAAMIGRREAKFRMLKWDRNMRHYLVYDVDL